ncbi:MAG: hypothetical protein KDI68_09490 [Gammaproteobacteria bacterium]|nr:hypothetical protein [Gammaproteobacteria bacterium]
MEPRALRFVVALPSEAKPINRHFGLVRDNRAEAFSLYRNGSAALVISGVGSDLAARATEWLHGYLPQPAIWFNVGIAGHPHRAIGEALLAHRIVDRQSGREWQRSYPGFPCSSASLITCIEPERDYPDDALYDMEGASFYAALDAAGAEHTGHCFKIVSDNLHNPVEQINRELINGLMEQNLPLLERLCHLLTDTSQREPGESERN